MIRPRCTSPNRVTRWRIVGALPVKINPQLALRYDDGRAEAVRLYFDPEPPAEEAVLATFAPDGPVHGAGAAARVRR